MYDVYSTYKDIYELWEQLKKKYIIEDAGAQKYVVANFLDFKMSEEKIVIAQIYDYYLLLNDLKNENIVLPKPFIVSCLIEKLPKSRNFTRKATNKRKNLTLENSIVHIRIKEKNRQNENIGKAKKLVSKANLVECDNHDKKKHQDFTSNNHFKKNKASFKKNNKCYVYEKGDHFAYQYKPRNKKRNNKTPKANLVEGKDVIV